jgi:3-phenylpropionate/trans-cinnamate dioxygenase ferredoxin subunit
MARYIVGISEEIQPGERKLVQVANRSVGIFNVHGRFYALKNSCIHDQAPVCLGTIGATYLPSAPGEFIRGMEAQVLRCPWHGWEFDITTGCSLFDRAIRLVTYPVTVEDGQLVIEIGGAETR